MLTLFARRVISRIRRLKRTKDFGAIARLISGPSVKLNPRNFRSCGLATALSFSPFRCARRVQTICAAQPQEILRRVLGVDGSVRSPYNITRNFLGDRAITVDFSYRVRQLYYAEPFFNETYLIRNPLQQAPPEGQSFGTRSYTRITFIAPFSAYFQFRATWQHGSLPPLFQYVGDEVALGLAFSNPGSSEH
jgi:hypothetical protein